MSVNCSKKLVCAMLFILFVFSILLLLSVRTEAYAETKTYFSAEKYTESDKLLNSDGTINENRDIRSFAHDVNYYASYSTPITELGNVIPLQYLESQEANDVFAYNGKEYGFYVVKEGEDFTVLLIDFIFEFGNEEGTSDLEYRIQIKPIMQQGFRRKMEKDGSYSWYMFNNQYSYTYFVANPRFASVLYNDNSLNYGDNGYSKYADDGLIINQCRLNYSAISTSTGNTYQETARELAVRALFSCSCVALDKLVQGTGTINSIIGDVADCIIVSEERTISADNENNIKTNMSKFDQLKNDKYDSFSRSLTIEPSKTEPSSNIVLSSYKESYAEVVTVLNDSNHKSRLIQRCDFDIVRRVLTNGPIEYVTGREDDETFSFQYERNLFEDSQPEFKIDRTNLDDIPIHIYLLSHSKQEITFTPQYTGVYSFELPKDTEMLLNGVSNISFNLQAGQTYSFKVVGTVDSKIIGELRCSTEKYSNGKTYTVSSANNKILRYYPTDSGYHKVTLSNNNLKIGLLNEKMNELVSADSNSFYYNFIEGRKYYFIICNSASVAITTNITINSVQGLSLGAHNISEIESTVSFTNAYNAIVDYDLSLNEPNILSAVIISKFGQELAKTSYNQDGIVYYSFTLGAKETCYIHFFGNVSNSSLATVSVSSTQCKWIVNSEQKTNPTRLDPLTKYTIELQIESNGKVIDTIKNFTISTTVSDYRHWEGNLYIGQVANKKEIHVIPKCAVNNTLVIIVDNLLRDVKLVDYNDVISYVKFELNKEINNLNKPTRIGHTFLGYYERPNGQGKQYVSANMEGERWDKDVDNFTLYAHWEANTYTITFNDCGNSVFDYKMQIKYGEVIPDRNSQAPSKTGYEFVGYFDEPNGNGNQFYTMQIRDIGPKTNCIWVECIKPIRGVYDIDRDITLYAHFKPLICDYYYENISSDSNECLSYTKIKLTNNEEVSLSPSSIPDYIFDYYEIEGKKITELPYKFSTGLYRASGDGKVYVKKLIFCYYKKTCVAQGTLITLADGTQVPVESLKGEEMLLVWNMLTGKLDAARIMFVDSDKAATYKVINLGFSDGTTVKVISEHGFWDYDLNKFVYLRSDASKYIGHYFNKGDTRVQLTSVDIRDEYTVAYSPVTYGHLCYYVNGMLSMPGGIDGLFNIFDVDPDTMTVNADAMARDIATYGLFTYDEFVELVPVTEDVFNAFNGQYLKVAIGKGMITVEQLNSLVERYAEFFVEA